MDEKLISTVHKIKKLAEQNPEFRQEMQRFFGKTVSASVHNGYDERITHIEKYLGLDYYTDSMPSVIDYSFIQEPDVRTQLISDNREMLRFRHGTRFHEILFEEFCRYAQLQAEMLINYFYYHKDSTVANAISHIKRFFPNAQINSNTFSLASIPFNTKLWSYCDEFHHKKVKEVFDYVREVRNYQSHRSPSGQEFSFFDYQKKLLDWNIILRSDGSFDYFKTKENTLAYSIYESRVRNTKDFRQYQYLVWFNKKPFDDIISKLKQLAESVKNNL